MPDDPNKLITAAENSHKLTAAILNPRKTRSTISTRTLKKRKLPIINIRKSIEAIERDANTCQKNVDAAEDNLQALQKLKDPASGATNLIKKLEGAVKDGNKATKELRNYAE